MRQKRAREPMSARTKGFGVAAGVVGMTMSFASAASALVAGRMSDALVPLVFFVLASASLLYLLHRRPRSELAIEHVNRLRFGAVMFLVFGMTMCIGLIAFALVEAIWNRAYGWLLLIPFALWVLRGEVIGVGNVLRANSDDPRWPKSGRVPL